MNDRPPRQRLIPRWWTAVVLLLLVAGVLAGAVMTLVSDGALAWSGGGLLVASIALLVTAFSALLRPRRRVPPEVLADGTRVFRAPAVTVAGLLIAWAMLLVVAAVWACQVVADAGQVASPGAALMSVVGAVASLPDLARLLTGRLHRWTLALGPEGLSYRGYRTSVTVPWREVTGAAVQPRHPAGVRVGLRAGRDPLVVPITAFGVAAEQLVDEVHRARRAARRR
ncbi:hypothetical protein ACJ5H2_14065 [Nocardioides sp. R1-1]|uniref:hypothetical protein n=1 Tax=Nocardioides sp. R1-1 TaxID=3383502 RepID=UPI0038D1DE87